MFKSRRADQHHMANNACRLRKYRRRKLRTKDPVKFARLARLYWRYHHKVHGPVQNLWQRD